MSFDFLKGITPKLIDIDPDKRPIKKLLTTSTVEIDSNTVKVFVKNGKKIISTYKMEIPPSTPEPHPHILGILESVVVARTATEALVNIENSISHPYPDNLDEVLSKYGLADVAFVGENYRSYHVPEAKNNTLLLSGGVDSTHLLFKHLKGNCNAISLSHGQPAFHIGKWPEKRAATSVVELARNAFRKKIQHTILRARFDSELKREWAKAYRNFLSILQASIVYPNTKVWIGTNIQDELHDCSPDFIKDFSEVTGIDIQVPNLNIGRREIMKDMIDMSLKKYSYLYANTASCQMSRFSAGKSLFCGSCHSCLLRLPAAEFGADPRFSNFNKRFKVIPRELEKEFTYENYYKRRPSVRILKTFLNDFDNEPTFKDFVPCLKMVESEWNINCPSLLNEVQLKLYNDTNLQVI